MQLLKTDGDVRTKDIPPAARDALDQIVNWSRSGADTFLDNNGSKPTRKGYRALFNGPSGTGKTLAATLLGQQLSRDVYRIDLAREKSRYIGETERNISTLFEKAERNNAILFFDEADALFGARGEVADAHDRYANQEVSYLLQRIESHSGIVILASNMRKNIDDAFSRRFELVVLFD